jgi:hypothetical protein
MIYDNTVAYAVYGIYCNLSPIPPMPFDVWIAESIDNPDVMPDWDAFGMYQAAGGLDSYTVWLFRRHGVNQ